MRLNSNIFKNIFYILLFLIVTLFSLSIILQNRARITLLINKFKSKDSTSQQDLPSDFKIMTYNINHCLGTDNIYDPDRISDIIKSQAPSIVCLNKVDYKTKRSNFDEQARKIAANLGMEFSFGKVFETSEGWQGNAILTSYPLVFAENKRFNIKENDFPSGVLHTILQINKTNLHLFITNLSSDSLIQAKETSELLKAIIKWGDEELGISKDPMIIAGDFNMKPGEKSIREILYYFHDTGSALNDTLYINSNEEPVIRQDYIFANNLLRPLSTYIINTENTQKASKSLPFVVHFELK